MRDKASNEQEQAISQATKQNNLSKRNSDDTPKNSSKAPALTKVISLFQ